MTFVKKKGRKQFSNDLCFNIGDKHGVILLQLHVAHEFLLETFPIITQNCCQSPDFLAHPWLFALCANCQQKAWEKNPCTEVCHDSCDHFCDPKGHEKPLVVKARRLQRSQLTYLKDIVGDDIFLHVIP